MTYAENRYEKMNYRQCGNSGLYLPAISLGFWQNLGKAGNEDLCAAAMKTAFDHGVCHWDFANDYGPPAGNAEVVAGKLLKLFPRDELCISSKAGYPMWPGPYGDGGSKKYLVASCDQSLKRLGLDYLDIFYHHRFTPNTPMEESMEALDYIVKSGRALYAGISSYNGEQTERACAIIKERNLTRITIHQPLMNMVVREHEKGLLPVTKNHGIGVIPFCPLAQGLLTDKYLNGMPVESRRGQQGSAGSDWYQQQKASGNIERARKLNELAKERGQTLAQLALIWLLRDKAVTSVLVGISKVNQLMDNLEALDNMVLSDEELNRIETILA